MVGRCGVNQISQSFDITLISITMLLGGLFVLWYNIFRQWDVLINNHQYCGYKDLRLKTNLQIRKKMTFLYCKVKYKMPTQPLQVQNSQPYYNIQNLRSCVSLQYRFNIHILPCLSSKNTVSHITCNCISTDIGLDVLKLMILAVLNLYLYG